MDKSVKTAASEIVIGIVIAVVATLASNQILSLSRMDTVLLCGLAFLTYSLLLFLNKNGKKLKAVSDIGIENVLLGKARLGIKDYEVKETGEFIFFGISGKRIIEDLTIQEKLKQIGKRNHKIRFLLLSPASEHLYRKALDENDNPEIWKTDITLSIQKLKEFANTNAIKIEIRTYDFLPIWRLVFMNNDLLYLTYFFKGRQGIESPMVKLKDDQFDNLYRAYKFQFEEIWDYQSNEA